MGRIIFKAFALPSCWACPPCVACRIRPGQGETADVNVSTLGLHVKWECHSDMVHLRIQGCVWVWLCVRVMSRDSVQEAHPKSFKTSANRKQEINKADEHTHTHIHAHIHGTQTHILRPSGNTAAIRPLFYVWMLLYVAIWQIKIAAEFCNVCVCVCVCILDLRLIRKKEQEGK